MSRIIADIPTKGILQVEKTPEIGDSSEFGGRFTLPVPDGASVDLDSTSYILPQDGGDVGTQLAAALLARYPMYTHIAYNFLLEAADVDDLDLALLPAVSPLGPITVRTRAQSGRGAALPGPTGQVPTTTAILPVNALTSPARAGMLCTDTINIGPPTGGAGADEFLLWWKVYEMTTGPDIASDFGMFAGTNTPGSRLLEEIDQEPVGLSAYISHDDGVTWTATGLLVPTDMVVFDTSVRILFVNLTTNKIYLAAYAVMF
jgi:hypothetical protein